MENILDTTFTQCAHGSPKCKSCKNKRVIEWIGVDERFPKNNDHVLVFFTALYSELKTALYYDDSFFVLDEDVTKWISHWADISRLKPND